MKVIDTGIHSAQANMAWDEAMLQKLEEQEEAILHFYEWSAPSATFGHFTNPYVYLRQEPCLELAKRPTGGGVIFHLTDLAFSLFIPKKHPFFSVNTLYNYRTVHERVLRALLAFDPQLQPSLLLEETDTCEPCSGFCMAQPTQGDVMVAGKKVAGGAQRRTRHGFLHQGSISLSLPPPQTLKEAFKAGSEIWEAIEANTYPLISPNNSFSAAKASLKECLAAAFGRNAFST